MLTENAQPFDVLLVEDELADAHLVRTSIVECKARCNLHHVVDGLDALAFLKRADDRYGSVPQPNLILLDLNMPRMNGGEFLAAVKADESLASIPVVVLTTSDAERDVAAVYKLGAAGFVTKPVDMGQFIDVIGNLLGYWLTLVRLPRRE